VTIPPELLALLSEHGATAIAIERHPRYLDLYAAEPAAWGPRIVASSLRWVGQAVPGGLVQVVPEPAPAIAVTTSAMPGQTTAAIRPLRRRRTEGGPTPPPFNPHLDLLAKVHACPHRGEKIGHGCSCLHVCRLGKGQITKGQVSTGECLACQSCADLDASRPIKPAAT
jgi:hypothetical protein